MCVHGNLNTVAPHLSIRSCTSTNTQEPKYISRASFPTYFINYIHIQNSRTLRARLVIYCSHFCSLFPGDQRISHAFTVAIRHAHIHTQRSRRTIMSNVRMLAGVWFFHAFCASGKCTWMGVCPLGAGRGRRRRSAHEPTVRKCSALVHVAHAHK